MYICPADKCFWSGVMGLHSPHSIIMHATLVMHASLAWSAEKGDSIDFKAALAQYLCRVKFMGQPSGRPL